MGAYFQITQENLMANFVYPTSAELIQIAQDKIPALVADRPIFEILPMATSDEFLLLWEQSRYKGYL